MDLAILEKQALRLKPEERAVLADHLLQSLEEESVLSAWLKESADRMAAYDRKELEAFDAEETLAELRAELTG